MPDNDKVLYEIHENQLDTGLRGFPVGTCRTSSVDKETGVSYVGYAIDQLAPLPTEKVIYLLLNKRLPTDEELEAFRTDLRSRQSVPDAVFTTLKSLPSDAHPMEWFITGLLALGMAGKTGDYKQDTLNMIARINVVTAAIFRLREGWGEPIPPRDDLSYGANFSHMLGVPSGHEQLPELLRLFHVLHMDHGGGNLSTFTGKAVASGLAGVYVSLAGAMGALYGPLHGRANQECLKFVQEVGTSDEAEIERFVRDLVAKGGKVFGFGHAVLRAEDPRARVQYAFGEEHFGDHPLVRTALALRKVVPPILKEHPKISNPYPNVDAISGSLLCAAGLNEPEYYTVLFGWSRVVGIAAQIIDERHTLRGGKGVPIYRPRYVAEEQPKQSL
ncbi:MAG: citrate (Si)-synthase [Planctomycetota bacterium]